MREIGTPKIDSHITNSHIKRPRKNKLEDMFQKRPFLNRIYAKSLIKRPHIMKDACILNILCRPFLSNETEIRGKETRIFLKVVIVLIKLKLS